MAAPSTPQTMPASRHGELATPANAGNAEVKIGWQRPAAASGRMRRPLLWVAAVIALALLSYYVHILQGQVERGERFRQAQRAEGQQARDARTSQNSQRALAVTQALRREQR